MHSHSLYGLHNTNIFDLFSTKFEKLHYIQWQLRRTMTLTLIKILEDVCTNGFRVGQSEMLFKFLPVCCVVAMVTNICYLNTRFPMTIGDTFQLLALYRGVLGSAYLNYSNLPYSP